MVQHCRDQDSGSSSGASRLNRHSYDCSLVRYYVLVAALVTSVLLGLSTWSASAYTLPKTGEMGVCSSKDCSADRSDHSKQGEKGHKKNQQTDFIIIA